MNCPKCNSYVSDNMRFCVHCGFDMYNQQKGEAKLGELKQSVSFANLKQNASFETLKSSLTDAVNKTVGSVFSTEEKSTEGHVPSTQQRYDGYADTPPSDAHTDESHVYTSWSDTHKDAPHDYTPHRNEQKKPKSSTSVTVVVSIIVIIIAFIAVQAVGCGPYYF